MSGLREYDHGPEDVARRRSQAPVLAQATESRSFAFDAMRSASTALALQRLAGNRAVAQLMVQRAAFWPSTKPVTYASERAKVEKALQSDEPSDVKDIKDFGVADPDERVQLASTIAFKYSLFLGPEDRRVLNATWGSLTKDELTSVGSKRLPMWEKCVEEYPALRKLPNVKAVRDDFTADIKQVARDNLRKNIDYLAKEHNSIDSPWVTGNPFEARIKRDEEARLRAMISMAGELLSIKRSQKAMLEINVGFKYVHGFGSNVVQQPFRPHARPQHANVKGPTWDDVNEHYEAASAELAAKASTYPWIFALLRDDEGEHQLEALSKMTSTKAAAETIQSTLRAQISRAETVAKRLRLDNLDWYALVPIRQQLMAGRDIESGRRWDDPITNFRGWAARDAVGERQDAEWWTEFGLHAAAEIGLIAVTLATAGTDLLFVGLIGAAAAVGTPATAAYLDYQKSEDLSAIAKSTVLPGTDLVAQAQADEARAQAVAETLRAVVLALATGVPLVRTLALEVKLLRLAKLDPAAQAGVVAEAVQKLGALRTSAKLGLPLKDVLAKVGATSEAGSAVQKQLNALLEKPVNELTAEELRALGLTPGAAADRVPVELWRCLPEDRALLRRLLGNDRYAEEAQIIEQLKKAHPELEGIPTEELVAVRRYTHPDGYKEMNLALRYGDQKELARLAPYIRSARSGLNQLPAHVGKVYRKTQLTPDMAAQFVEGQNYVEKSFMSASTKQNMPQFTGNAGITVESVTGRNITLLSKSAKEGEVLFPPGTTFLVTKKTSIGQGYRIWMREVAAAPL